MGDKKDPGKFTIRFNVADPQQQAVADLLNRQGRYKAQFITNAVMLYAYAASDVQTVSLLNGTAIQNIMAGVQPKFRETIPPTEVETDNSPNAGCGNGLEDTDLDAILKTMDAFHPK